MFSGKLGKLQKRWEKLEEQPFPLLKTPLH